MDVIDTEVEVEADVGVEAEHFDPKREMNSYTDRCKNPFSNVSKWKKNEDTLLKSCFNPTLEFTLEPELDLELPLRLDDGLFSFSALNPCLDLDFEPDLDGPLLPLVDLNPDLLSPYKP